MRLLPLLLLLCSTQVTGQDYYDHNFEEYTRADGLSHNTVYAIVQDSAGYVWIATASGLNRYDGSRFVQFHSTGDSSSLAAEDLPGMSWLDKRRLAVYTAGLHIIDTRTGKSRNIFIPCEDRQFQYKYNMIAAAIGDKDGNIFILTRSGFYQYDKDYKLVFRYDYYKKDEVAVNHFYFGRDLYELDDRRLFIVAISGLYIYDKKEKRFSEMKASDCPLMAEFLNYSETNYYRFLQPKPGNFFIFRSEGDTVVYVNTITNRKVITKLPFTPPKSEFHWHSSLLAFSDTLFYITGQVSGFYKMGFDPQSGKINLYPEKYFTSYSCNSLLKDRDNNLWIGTNKGLLRQDMRKSQVQMAYLPQAIQDSFPNARFDDIYIADDKIYTGLRGQGGLIVFDRKTFQFVKQIRFEKYGSRGNSIYSFASVDPSSLMLATDEPLLLFDRNTKKETRLLPPLWNVEGDWTNDLYKDRKGKIWISSYHIYRYDPVTHQFTIIPNYERLLAIPFVLEEDQDGNIWMAGHGMARYNPVLDSFDMVVDSFPFIKMPDKQVNAMVIDQQNRLWFNSNNNGLIAYDINGKTFRHFTKNDGLLDDNIASMIIIGRKLWIASYSGITCMDLKTYQMVNFGKDDGFPDMSIIKGARFFYDSLDNQLYLGFARAIVRFNPDHILAKKSPPHVFIEDLVINGQKNNFLPDSHITTSWYDNEIMITIGSINFSDGHSQGFAYRILKGGNDPWQQLGSQPSFSISNLLPGTYRIQVKSFSLNNRWPEQVKEISIEVLPPFWQRTWFILLLMGIITVLIYLLIKWRTSLARKKEMEKTHIQKLNAEYYKNQFELEQISNYFSSSLAEKKTEEEVLWDVAQNLIGGMNYADCMIYLWNEDKSKMIQKAAYGPKGNPESISQQVFDVVPGQGVVGYVMQTCKPVLISDTRKDSRYRMDEMFRLSEICVPIIHDGELMGIIDSEHHELNYFKEQDLKILTTIATLVGNKLKQLESEKSLQVKQEELVSINEQLAEAQLSALQAQMNPHFVFNALNSIKRMILDGDNKKASRYLSKFALMIRMTLNHSKDLFVTLDENIEYLKTYVEMEQLRFDGSFTYTIYTGDNIDALETTIPSLMMQPLVENAIWHGLMHVEGEKKIKIGFTQDQNRITCTIEDNGIGIKQSERLKRVSRPLHHSVGLENLYKRIKIMNEKYDTDCRLEITDLKERDENSRGTLVVLCFNIINQ